MTPSFLFIMSDDHAAHAIGAYGSRINRTPHLDRIASGGMRFTNCFCTNSICAPSRAAILTGTYNHVNGVTTLTTDLDNQQDTFIKQLGAAGYQTAVIGKWHLGQGPAHEPAGFDFWSVLPGQGDYHDPTFIQADGRKKIGGYVTDVITDRSLEWLRDRDKERPFCLLVHHKAPHRPWLPDEKHALLYEDEDIPLPDTFDDEYDHRARAAREARMRVERDLKAVDLKQPVPPGLSPREEKEWKYQRYIKDYLRCVASIDDNVGRLLDFLDEEGLADNTVVVYTSDQGFFLGDHGWYDKRFMYEESLRMPFLIRYPREIAPSAVNENLILNVDIAPTFLDLAGAPVPDAFQGVSFRPLLGGEMPKDWQTSLYYRYWMHGADHNVYAHYGVRTLTHKLIYYYADPLDQPGAVGEPEPPEWELFDLIADPGEMHSVYDNPAYEGVVRQLKAELRRLQEKVGDKPYSRENETTA